ncbi:type II secretion system protein [Prochlorococcus sp. MIT 0801]|uniref:type II secretion system protein n=1 Tax=Prochlorococcus sp. MIT 0801 TaxID=1501269 RepID=UPI0004F67B8A|nr:type II secretion system protein [Prochlorococcus sp. MIT 0801]AIQ97337.1 hypothetical protein EW15_1245 [Prochlorococcus sp. MIT 0801]
MNLIQTINKKPPHLISSEEGFSIIELTFVVLILGILGSLGIGNITKWTKLAKIDEAMTIMNNSLIECLASTRSGTDPETVSPPSSVIDNNRLSPTGYKVKTDKDKCSEFYITPISSDEKILFEMGYEITSNNQVTKISDPADNQASLNRCKRWGGPNCGPSQLQKDKWAYQKEYDKKSKKCETDFSNFRLGPPKGSGLRNRWDVSIDTQGCTLATCSTEYCSVETWLYKGDIVSNEDEYKQKQEEDLGKECSAAILAQKATEFSGAMSSSQLNSCVRAGQPEVTYYFCLGDKKNDEDDMNACISANEAKIIQQQEDECSFNRNEARLANPKAHDGKYGPHPGPGTCGETFWMCDEIQYTTESEYNNSNCANTGGGNGGGGNGGGGNGGGGNNCAGDCPTHAQCLAKSDGPKFLINMWCKQGSGLSNDPLCHGSGYRSCMGF